MLLGDWLLLASWIGVVVYGTFVVGGWAFGELRKWTRRAK